MDRCLTIPHRVAHGMCPVNGIRDLVHWRAGRDWSNEFLHGLGQGGGFAYLRFNAADPPRQVYWGISGPRQHEYLAQLLGAGHTVIENRSFKFSWQRARAAVDAGTPPVLGPLDMFHLHYYDGIYHERHIPIHYVLLVSTDDHAATVYDTDKQDPQAIPLSDLQLAWDVNVPGMGRRNRLVVFDVPRELAPAEDLIRRSIADQCQTMLRPPVSMLGIPAMVKLANEIANWPDEVGKDRAAVSLQQVREYLNAPPDLAGDHLTAGRDRYINFLEQAGPMAGMDLAEPIGRLRHSMAVIPGLAQAIRQGRLDDAADVFRCVAEMEAAAYAALGRIVGDATPVIPR